MNRPELYRKTVDTLLTAYNEGELEHGKCHKCALGNICGADEWVDFFFTSKSGVQHTAVPLDSYRGLEYKSTGYSVEELTYIEREFEHSIRGFPLSDMQCEILAINYGASCVAFNSEEWLSYQYYKGIDKKKGQYIGLCAVLDALRDIHDIDGSEHQTSREKLTETAESKGVLVN